MSPLVALTFAVATAASGGPAADTAPAPRPRMVILELERRGVEQDLARTLDESLSVSFSRSSVFDVITPADLRAMLDVEAGRRDLGACADQDSCIAEIATALGADAVVHGAVARVEDRLVLTLSLFDARTHRAAGREQRTSTSAAELMAQLDQLAQRLTASWLGDSASSPAPGVSSLLIAGGAGAVIGVVTAGAGLWMLGGAQSVLDDPRSLGPAKEQAGADYSLGSTLAFAGLGVLAAGATVAGLAVVME